MRYRVRYSENLCDISARFGVSVDAIMRANGLRRFHVAPGTVLWIPIQHHYYPGQPHHGQQHYGQQYPDQSQHR